MYEDLAFRRMLVAYARGGFRWTNFLSERGLGGVRRAVGSDVYDAERIPSVGLMSEMLTEHKKLSRQDPRTLTRSQLLSAGVPILAKRKTAPQRVAGSFIEYRKNHDQERIEHGIALNKAEYTDYVKDLGLRFRAEAPAVRAECKAKVDRIFAEASAGGDSEELPDSMPPTAAAMRSFVAGTGDQHWPVSMDRFTLQLRLASGRLEGPVPGFNAYEEQIRESSRQEMFVKEEHMIESDEEFDYTLPCPLRHEGICQTEHSWYIKDMESIAIGLRRCRASNFDLIVSRISSEQD